MRELDFKCILELEGKIREYEDVIPHSKHVLCDKTKLLFAKFCQTSEIFRSNHDGYFDKVLMASYLRVYKLLNAKDQFYAQISAHLVEPACQKYIA